MYFHNRIIAVFLSSARGNRSRFITLCYVTLNWLQNQLSRMAKRDFMPLPGVSGSHNLRDAVLNKDRLTQKFQDPEINSG